MTSDWNLAARELLTFYREAGVDALLDETPADRFAEPAPPINASASAAAPASPTPSPVARPVASPTMPTARPAVTPPSPDAAVMAAREAARRAPDLQTLRDILDRFEGCALRATASRLVFADGNPAARVMFVG